MLDCVGYTFIMVHKKACCHKDKTPSSFFLLPLSPFFAQNRHYVWKERGVCLRHLASDLSSFSSRVPWGAFIYDVHKLLGIFYPLPPLSAKSVVRGVNFWSRKCTKLKFTLLLFRCSACPPPLSERRTTTHFPEFYTSGVYCLSTNLGYFWPLPFWCGRHTWKPPYGERQCPSPSFSFKSFVSDLI